MTSFVALMIFWFVMSGFFDPIHGLMGLASVLAVMALNYQLKKHQYFEDEVDVLNELRYLRMSYYIFWLLWQIILSGIQVVRIILSPKMPIKPQVIRFKVDLPSAHAKMILGNSITLTPGTLTVDINDDEFLVHSLVPGSYEGIVDDSMPQQVLKLFTKQVHPVVSDVTIANSTQEL